MVIDQETIEGEVFPPLAASSLNGWMWRDEQGCFWLETQDTPPQPVQIKRVSDPVAGLDNQVWLVDGQRFLTKRPLPSSFYAKKAAWWAWLLWFEKFSLIKLAAVIGLLVLVIIGYHRLLPVLADGAVYFVPHEWDVAVGNNSWETVDALLFEPSMLEKSDQAALQALFAPISPLIAKAGYQPRLVLRSAPQLGANAVALPGGIVVITDDLWRLLENKPELVQAIMAHEAEHILARHSMRQIVRYIGLASVIFAFGLEDSLIEEMSIVFSEGLMARYSREFETEADLGAARIMQQIGRRPEAMIEALSSLGLALCGEQGCPEQGWFDSHPDIAQRIKDLEMSL